jgi:hypothetical protein
MTGKDRKEWTESFSGRCSNQFSQVSNSPKPLHRMVETDLTLNVGGDFRTGENIRPSQH